MDGRPNRRNRTPAFSNSFGIMWTGPKYGQTDRLDVETNFPLWFV